MILRSTATVMLLSVLWGTLGCGPHQPALPFAEATLEARPPIPGDPAPSAGSAEPKIYTAIHELLSDRVLEAVLADPAVQATSWYKKYSGNDDHAHASLANGVLRAEYLPGTTQLRLRVLALPVNDSLVLLEAWLDAYQAEVSDRAESRYLTDYRSYETQFNTVQHKIEEAETRLQQHLADHPADATDETQRLRRDLEHLELQRVEARKKMDELLTLIRRAGNMRLEIQHPPAMVQP